MKNSFDMEDLSNSEEYKRAYTRADRICRYMPHLVNKMSSPQGETLAQKQAFEDRITEYHIEQDSMKNMPRNALMKKYGSKLKQYQKRKSEGRSRSRD